MKLVLDTNVLVSGLLWSGPPGEILDRVDDEIDKLFVSRGLLEELLDVLVRPKFAKALHRCGHDPLDLVATVVAWAVVVEAKPLAGVVIRADPTDDRVLACAGTVDADVIVSGDEHLLRLGSFRGIRIVTAATYLQEVRA